MFQNDSKSFIIIHNKTFFLMVRPISILRPPQPIFGYSKSFIIIQNDSKSFKNIQNRTKSFIMVQNWFFSLNLNILAIFWQFFCSYDIIMFKIVIHTITILHNYLLPHNYLDTYLIRTSYPSYRLHRIWIHICNHIYLGLRPALY